jgi:hypothetical protein
MAACPSLRHIGTKSTTESYSMSKGINHGYICFSLSVFCCHLRLGYPHFLSDMPAAAGRLRKRDYGTNCLLLHSRDVARANPPSPNRLFVALRTRSRDTLTSDAPIRHTALACAHECRPPYPRRGRIAGYSPIRVPVARHRDQARPVSGSSTTRPSSRR